MGSSRGNCEIVEANDEPTTIKPPQTFRQVRGQDRERKPPNPKKGPNKSLNDDINKLFESVNLRTSKSLDLSDSWRNASKRPMKGTTGSHSPRIGFSEPVSLKQALRGMCISQAAEMAALKRLSMPSASPRMSEAGKITNLYTSVGESRMKNSVMTEESTSYSSEASSRSNQYYDSSPAFCATQDMKSIKCVPDEPGSGYSIGMSFVEGGNSNCSTSNITPTAEVDIQLDETVCSKEEKHDLVPHHNVHDDDVLKSHKKMSGLNKVASGVSKDCASKAAPKPRQKSRLQTVTSSTAVKSNKDVKSTKNTSRAVKPVIRNKNLVIKKSKKVAVSADISDTSYEVSSEQMICQRCQCSLKDTNNDSSKDPPTTTSVQAFTDSRKCEASKSDLIPSTPVVNTIMTSKSSEKGDISQSSKSSICDFSSSTTSLSDESNLSGPTCGNRPHMSKDVRWGAISFIGKRYGFLGLNHFNLLKKLGCGDIGTVYLAELIGTNCLFAIKVMDNEFLGKRKKMVRAQTEREILRMLDHPFLPTLYAQFTSDNLSCYVMEFCPGGDLHVLRQKQPGRYFPEQEARFYVAEVLLALEYLHMLGIVYRDLKPENILVREDGHIMLTDFDLSLRCSVSPILVKSSSSTTEPPRVSGPCAGSNCIDPFCAGPSCQVSCFSPRLLHTNAKARKVKTDAIAQARLLPMLVAEPTEARSNSFVGTHEYLAPEIIKGEGHGSAVDWWTFGVFLYELLYGKTPFKGVENEETLTNVVMQNLKFPDSPMVSFQARDLIRGLLVKEPENRLGTEMGAAEIKRHPFFEGLNWALIRCAVPPQIPEFFDVESSGRESHEEGVKFVEYNGNGHPLEFELF